MLEKNGIQGKREGKSEKNNLKKNRIPDIFKFYKQFIIYICFA